MQGHLFYGLSMLKPFERMGKRKPYMIFSLTDETYSLLCGVSAPEGIDPDWFLFFISLLDQLLLDHRILYRRCCRQLPAF